MQKKADVSHAVIRKPFITSGYLDIEFPCFAAFWGCGPILPSHLLFIKPPYIILNCVGFFNGCPIWSLSAIMSKGRVPDYLLSYHLYDNLYPIRMDALSFMYLSLVAVVMVALLL